MKKDKMKLIELRLPQHVIAALKQHAQLGILGETEEEVVTHMLRQGLWEYHVRQRAIEAAMRTEERMK